MIQACSDRYFVSPCPSLCVYIQGYEIHTFTTSTSFINPEWSSAILNFECEHTCTMHKCCKFSCTCWNCPCKMQIFHGHSVYQIGPCNLYITSPQYSKSNHGSSHIHVSLHFYFYILFFYYLFPATELYFLKCIKWIWLPLFS